MNYMNYTRKAWEVVGYALDGGVYCLECANNGDAVTEGNPVFVSDLGDSSAFSFAGLTCESCHEEVA
jgi:hypothetical protein